MPTYLSKCFNIFIVIHVIHAKKNTAGRIRKEPPPLEKNTLPGYPRLQESPRPVPPHPHQFTPFHLLELLFLKSARR